MSKSQVFKIGPNSPGTQTVVWIEPFRPDRIIELVPKEQADKLAEALKKIANEDYRGNRPWSATVAYQALKDYRGE